MHAAVFHARMESSRLQAKSCDPLVPISVAEMKAYKELSLHVTGKELRDAKSGLM